ncbi:MAG: hypothetical protein S4CHLAM123_10590 [Chlamydiales bacterium]|nr:hypothetical protein [Chlamydiales bacterium]
MGVVEMRDVFIRLFLKNWPRKLVALMSAIFIWFLVSQTITITRTITDVPIRVINLPVDKTVMGLLPNGLLNKRISITITGSKSIIQDLTSNDLEVVINADGQKESWIASISKRNLVSLNQEIDLNKHIKDVVANDQFIKLSKLITGDIPVTITKPVGDPPKGYQFLDVWPKYLSQKVSGPEEQVMELKQKGLDLTFNLTRISESELEALYETQQKDEIVFMIPDAWKKVSIPFKENALEPLNGPRAELLRLDFLKQELITLGTELPITIFFPLNHAQTINPQTYSLATSTIVQKKNGLKRLTIPLYLQDVPQLFLDIVRDNLLLIVVAAPNQEDLNWAVEFIDENALEEAFVKGFLKQVDAKYTEDSFTKYSEQSVRSRFRDYIRKFVLFTEDGEPLQLKAKLGANTITLEQK